MDKYVTKQKLYTAIDGLMRKLDLTPDDYPLNSIALAHKYCINLNLEYLKFENLCGILHKDNTHTSIALNALQSKESQNFSCMHELVHYFIHEDIDDFSCLSIENNGEAGLKQNVFLEWQANEGAAQALVPYQRFIPLYVQISLESTPSTIFSGVNETLASIFDVSSVVIECRIKSLQYEIYQYFVEKKQLTQLVILSKSKLDSYGLTDLVAEKYYCSNCYAIVHEGDIYCSICGQQINHFYYTKGLGYMNYDGISTDAETGKAYRCPVCDNENVELGQYCPICGLDLINRCTGGEDVECCGLTKFRPCGTVQPGFARFCVKCGCKTTFFVEGLLTDWQTANQLTGLPDSVNHLTDADVPL